VCLLCPRQDSNLRFRLRRPTLYPLSYGGFLAGSLTNAPAATFRAPRTPTVSSTSMGPRILVVDDDPVIVRLLEVNFRLDGFEVATATKGEDAVTLATEAPPDVILLDVMMPGMDGYEVYRRLREVPGVADVPVFFLSARAKDEDRARGIESGVIDYVTKPFDPTDLVAMVRRRVEGATP
jgi:two-component system, OmpR family, phosphate regulon response regulator PhoB